MTLLIHFTDNTIDRILNVREYERSGDDTIFIDGDRKIFEGKKIARIEVF